MIYQEKQSVLFSHARSLLKKRVFHLGATHVHGCLLDRASCPGSNVRPFQDGCELLVFFLMMVGVVLERPP